MASVFIFNAALAGAMGGPERWIESDSGFSYLELAEAAKAFAQAVDAICPSPTPGFEQPSARLMTATCQAFWADRLPQSPNVADYDAAAEAVVAQYVEAVQFIEAEPAGPPGPSGEAGASGAPGDIADELDDMPLMMNPPQIIPALVVAGIQGPPGQDGEDGADGTLVMMTAPSSDPSSSPAPVLAMMDPGIDPDEFLVTPQSGPDGPPGVQGIQGFQGPPGDDGLEGPEGASGPQGLPGATGTAGAQGIQGFQGPPGDDGLEGPEGASGPQGLPGATGTAGAQGIQGFQGPPGDDGLEGPEGASGPQGLPGANGADGSPGQGFQGPPGDDGQSSDDVPSPGVQLVSGLTLYGTYAARPLTANIGDRYMPSDGRLEFVFNGTVWKPVIGGIPGTQPPLVASFTTLGTSFTFADQTGTIVASVTANTRLSALVVAKAAAVTSVAHIRWAANGSTASTAPPGIGICVRDSVGGKLTVYAFYIQTPAGPPTLFSEVDHWTNLTTASATAKAQSAILGYVQGGLWMRFRDDGATTHFFDYSSNGVDWVTWFSESRTAFVPSGGNQVGWAIDNGGSLTANVTGNLISWSST